MGANNSSPYTAGSADPRLYIDDKDKSENHRLQYHGLLHYRGKPSPPDGTPSIRDITSSSATVLWTVPSGFPPRSILAYQVEICNIRGDKQWKVVTSCCQGTSYTVKNLKPDTEYMFRVRAENVFGKSKPSQTTAIVRTRSPERTFKSDSDSQNKLVRRHSYSIKMEGGVMTLVHKMDPNNRDSTSTLQRNSAMRSSLPILRKSSTSKLPGSNRQSFCSIKEKRRSVEDSTVCSDDDGSVQCHRNSISTEDDSCTQSMSTASVSSIPEESEELCDLKLGEDFTWKSQNSWKSDNHTISRDILSGPFSDEQKIDLFSKPDSCFKTFKDTVNEDVWKDRQTEDDITNISDLRSLRQVLNSNDMYVRTLGASDPNGNYTCGANRKFFPNPIKEVDEEDLALDIVSSI